MNIFKANNCAPNELLNRNLSPCHALFHRLLNYISLAAIWSVISSNSDHNDSEWDGDELWTITSVEISNNFVVIYVNSINDLTVLHHSMKAKKRKKITTIKNCFAFFYYCAIIFVFIWVSVQTVLHKNIFCLLNFSPLDAPHGSEWIKALLSNLHLKVYCLQLPLRLCLRSINHWERSLCI